MGKGIWAEAGRDRMMQQILPLLAATLIPVVVLILIYRLDLYKIGTFQLVLLCFVWGALAYGAAYAANTAISRAGVVGLLTHKRFIAPLLEETLKALILLYLVRRTDFTYLVDGAIYGFAIGIGFAVAENYQYVLVSNAAMSLAISRVLSTNLIHASASAICGIAMGLARFQRSLRRAGVFLGGLLAAFLLHAGFNTMVTGTAGRLLLFYAVVIGFLSTYFIVMMIKRGLAQEKRWIEEKLGARDRVTAGEVKVVQRMEDLPEILQPLKERFGEQKTRDIERFLTAQAKLGIQRKTLDRLTDEKMKRSLETQMDSARLEMDAARRGAGTYVMLYLRSIFPAETSPLWGRLQYSIDTRSTASTNKGGGDLWAALQNRTAAAADQEEKSGEDDL